MDIANLKSIIDKAISDYSQLADKKKNQKFADFENHTYQKMKAIEDQLPMDRYGNIVPENALNFVGGGGLPFAPSGVGIAGSILPLKKFLKTFEAGSGVVNKIVRNSDKSVKHVLTEDDAVEYYLNSINHLNKTKLRSGREAYINPNDPGNNYSGDWSTPDAKMFASFASNSEGSGKFNDILTGFFLDNGLYKPRTISRMNVSNRPTLEAMGEGRPLKDTLLGHSSDVIANNLL
jgi:hypothetical protein